MGRVKFQPPARGKGFSNIPNAQLMVAQLEKKLDRKKREDYEKLRKLKERDNEIEAKQYELDKAQEANLKQIDMSDSIHSTQMGALSTNAKQLVSNFQSEKASILNEGSGLREVLSHSGTAMNVINNVQQKDWEATMEGSYNYHMTHGLSEDQKIKLELLEDANWQMGQGFELQADKMQAEGYQPKEVEWVRGKNSASDYGRLKAYGNLALKDLVPTAKQEMLKRGITNVAEQKAFMKDFEIQYLKAHNLYDPAQRKAISADFLSEGLENVADQKRIFFNLGENAQAKEVADERAKSFSLPLQNNLNSKIINFDLAGQSVNNLYDAHRRRFNDDWTPFTPQQARDAVIEDLEDIEKFPNDAHVEAALRAAQGKDNFYTQQIPTLLKKRADARKTKLENESAAEEVRWNNDLKKTEKFFKPSAEDLQNGTGFNGSQEAAYNVLNHLIKRYPERAQDIQDQFGKYVEWTPQGRKDGDFSTTHYRGKWDEFRFTSEDFDDPNLPDEFKTIQKRMRVAEIENILDKADYDGRYKESVESALTNALVTEDLQRGGKIDDSYGLAKYHAENRFRACTVNTGDAANCATTLIEEINGKTGDFTVGSYGKGGKRTSKGAKSFFEKFSPATAAATKLDVNDFTTLNKEESDAALEMLSEKEHMIHNYLFLTREQLEEVSYHVRNGYAYRYPPIVNEISALNPKYFGSPMDVFRSQVEVATRMGLLKQQKDGEGKVVKGAIDGEDFKKTWYRQTNDPKAKHFIETLSTLDDVRKGITRDFRPESKHEPQFQSEQISDHTQKQPADPINLIDDGSYQYDASTAKEINNLIELSKGAVKKDQVYYDGNYFRVTGGSVEYFKKKGEENGYRYWPGEGWYKFNIRDEL